MDRNISRHRSIALRPVALILGWLLIVLGTAMLLPAAIDLADGNRMNAGAFAVSALLTVFIGLGTALSCSDGTPLRLDARQGFLLTSLGWVIFPLFGALPMMIGVPHLSLADAFFEAMSGMTTTGSTVIVGLDHLARGALLWRGLLNWIGGMGIVLMALVLLPVLNVGGMQLLRASDFNTMGKILPRTKEIAVSIGSVYLVLTAACAAAYDAAGMSQFDAAVHAMATIATGGFANYDSSFAGFSPAAQYVSTVFMLLGSLTFARFVQFVRGDARALFDDSQIRIFLLIYASFVTVILVVRLAHAEPPSEVMFREVAFNVASVISTTGFATTDFILWGDPTVALFFCVMMVGGCTGSTAGGVKIFRYELLFAAVVAELRRLYRPNIVILARYQGRPVPEGIMESVIAFVMLYFISLGVVSIALLLVGLDTVTAISGAATALGNVGPGLSPQIGPASTFAALPDAAKWLLSAAMMVGRLEIMVVFVLFTSAFWRA